MKEDSDHSPTVWAQGLKAIRTIASVTFKDFPSKVAVCYHYKHPCTPHVNPPNLTLRFPICCPLPLEAGSLAGSHPGSESQCSSIPAEILGTKLNGFLGWKRGRTTQATSAPSHPASQSVSAHRQLPCVSMTRERVGGRRRTVKETVTLHTFEFPRPPQAHRTSSWL